MAPVTSQPSPVVLPDGARLVVRPLEPEDRWAVLAVFAGLGDRSRRRRFGGAKPRLSASDLDRLTAVDHRDHEALLALEEGSGRPVAVARFVRDQEQPGTAEVAFAVADEWHGRRLGTLLAALLAGRACRLEVTRFRAHVVAGNLHALALVKRLGRVVRYGFEGPAVEIEVELAACSLS
jgi:RimJ/RimL family protein N-acetyltransferase